MELKIEHLAPYLPYGVEILWGTVKINFFTGNINYIMKDIENSNNLGEFKPLLIPMDSLGNDIEPILKSSCEILIKTDNLFEEATSYKDFKTLLKGHYDVFGLIDKGLAINKLKYNDNNK